MWDLYELLQRAAECGVQISPVIVAGTHKFQRCHRLTGALRDFEGVYLFGDKQIDPSPFGSFLGSRGRRSATKSLAVLIEDLPSRKRGARASTCQSTSAGLARFVSLVP